MTKMQTSLFGKSDICRDQSFLNNKFDLPLAVHFENIENFFYNRNKAFDVIKKCAFLPMANVRLIDFLGDYSENLKISKQKVENSQREQNFNATNITELLGTQQIGTTEMVQFANKVLTCINNSLQNEADENFTAKEFKTKYAKHLRSNKMKQEIIDTIEEEFAKKPMTFMDIKDEPNHLKNKPSSRTIRENETNISKLAKLMKFDFKTLEKSMIEADSRKMKLERNEKKRKKTSKVNRETLNRIKNEFPDLLLKPNI